jgi:hypothetical protein
VLYPWPAASLGPGISAGTAARVEALMRALDAPCAGFAHLPRSQRARDVMTW